MPEKKDYYDLLGIAKNASKEDVKSAYRRLAKKFHPDLNKDNPKSSEEKFKEISEAYEVLIDDNKRAKYDSYGYAGVESDFGKEGFSWQNFTHINDLEDIFGHDIFSDFFGARTSGYGKPERKIRRVQVEISLEQAYRGVSTEVAIPHMEKCGDCNGSGAEKGTSLKICNRCDGRGKVKQEQLQEFGRIIKIGVCPVCNGRGKIIEKFCQSCHGTGEIQRLDKIKIKIPPGVDNGTTLRIAPDKSGGRLKENIYVYISIQPHPFFRRQANDVYIKKEISLIDATLGSKVEVPTLDGNAIMKIPQGTQTNTLFRLRNSGMPYLRGHGHGDQYVRVIVKTPKNITKRQRELLEEFEKHEKEKSTKT